MSREKKNTHLRKTLHLSNQKKREEKKNEKHNDLSEAFYVIRVNLSVHQLM